MCSARDCCNSQDSHRDLVITPRDGGVRPLEDFSSRPSMPIRRVCTYCPPKGIAARVLKEAKRPLFWGLRPQTPNWSAFGLQMGPLGPCGTLWTHGGPFRTMGVQSGPFLGPDPDGPKCYFLIKQKTENCIFRLDFHFYMYILFFGVHPMKDLAELV